VLCPVALTLKRLFMKQERMQELSNKNLIQQRESP
jgi:hypothetical protein